MRGEACLLLNEQLTRDRNRICVGNCWIEFNFIIEEFRF